MKEIIVVTVVLTTVFAAGYFIGWSNTNKYQQQLIEANQHQLRVDQQRFEIICGRMPEPAEVCKNIE